MKKKKNEGPNPILNALANATNEIRYYTREQLLQLCNSPLSKNPLNIAIDYGDEESTGNTRKKSKSS